MRRLNRYVEERAPWQLAKDESKAAELDPTLRSLAEGLRVVTVLLRPTSPRRRTSCWRRSTPRDLRRSRARTSARGPAARVEKLPPLFPKPPVIDSHTHLDRGPAPEAELVAAAREAGVGRILTIGIDEQSRRAALAAAEQHDEVYAAIGHHPNNATGYDDAITAELRELAAHPRCLAIGETGLDDYRDYAPRARPGARLRRPDRARARGRQAARDPHPRRRGRHDRHARRARRGLEVILHCFSMPDRLDECLDHGWWISFAGNVTYPKAQDLAEAAERVPLDRLLVETDAPYLTPAAVRKHRNQPAYVVHTAAFVAERRGIAYEELEAAVEANAARLLGW